MELAIDCETTGVDLNHGARPFFVTICYEDGTQMSWDWDVDPFTRQPNIPKEEVEDINNRLVEADRIIGQNIRFDVKALGTVGVNKFDWNKIDDTLIAGHLLDSYMLHDLTSMCIRYLNVDISKLENDLHRCVEKCRRDVRSRKYGWMIAEKNLKCMPSAKETVWRNDYWLPKAFAIKNNAPYGHEYWKVLADYANADSVHTLALWKVFRNEMRRRGLLNIYQERMKILPITYDMETKGVTLSKTRLEEIKTEYEEESNRLSSVCENIAIGSGYDLVMTKSGSGNKIMEFVFDHLKLPVAKQSYKTGKPSLDKDALENYMVTLDKKSRGYLFLKSLAAKRKRYTAVTYMSAYERYWKQIDDSPDWFRLYPSFNPTATTTLRWSSNNPNAQNISKKEDFNLRYAFGPAPGREWWSLDYENIELRIPAYESGESAMIELFEKPDDPPYYGSYHLMNASIIYADLFWPLAKDKGAFKKKYASTWYQFCKNFGFAFQYGGGRATCDRAAHKDGAYEAIKSKLKNLTGLNQKYIDMANRHGYVETIPDTTVDRTKGYPIVCTKTDRGNVLDTVPLNYHVQSTAMWCTMKAMIRCDKYLKELSKREGKDYFMTMQVHDEIVFDFPKGKDKSNLLKVKKLQRLMEQSGDDIGIPLRVAITYNPVCWSEGE